MKRWNERPSTSAAATRLGSTGGVVVIGQIVDRDRRQLVGQRLLAVEAADGEHVAAGRDVAERDDGQPPPGGGDRAAIAVAGHLIDVDVGRRGAGRQAALDPVEGRHDPAELVRLVLGGLAQVVAERQHKAGRRRGGEGPPPPARHARHGRAVDPAEGDGHASAVATRRGPLRPAGVGRRRGAVERIVDEREAVGAGGEPRLEDGAAGRDGLADQRHVVDQHGRRLVLCVLLAVEAAHGQRVVAGGQDAHVDNGPPPPGRAHGAAVAVAGDLRDEVGRRDAAQLAVNADQHLGCLVRLVLRRLRDVVVKREAHPQRLRGGEGARPAARHAADGVVVDAAQGHADGAAALAAGRCPRAAGVGGLGGAAKHIVGVREAARIRIEAGRQQRGGQRARRLRHRLLHVARQHLTSRAQHHPGEQPGREAEGGPRQPRAEHTSVHWFPRRWRGTTGHHYGQSGGSRLMAPQAPSRAANAEWRPHAGRRVLRRRRALRERLERNRTGHVPIDERPIYSHVYIE